MVAEAHQGRIDLKSSEEEGTEFIIKISSKANSVGKTRTKLNLI
ncbi:hypothetical protein [Christiangramia portivictoriae]